MPAQFTRYLENFDALWFEATGIWISGGWAMLAIAVIALLMFTLGFNVFFRLRRKGFQSVPEIVWKRWIEHPLERRGKIGDLLDLVISAKTLAQISIYFDEVRKTETVPLERDLRLKNICVGAAPLVGLLGTVTGMLATFGALSSGSGGEKTMAMVASGISEALITTETGLVVALPGLFFQYQLTRQLAHYKAFLAHLESICTQRLHREVKEAYFGQIRVAARRQIARRLTQRLRAGNALCPSTDAVGGAPPLRPSPHRP
jgi:biopolymer transport protein ExbB